MLPRPIRVLVIDDEQDWLDSLRLMLGRRGYLVRTARSGQDGLAILAGEPCDVVIVDLRMPGMDGLEVMEAIRQLDPRLPIILVTADLPPDAAMALMKRYPYWDYMPKPFTTDRLDLSLQRAVAFRHLRTEASS